MSETGDSSARITALEADNQRLRRLLDQRNAPAELRHRLRSTLAMMRAIIRGTAMTSRAVDDYVGHLEDRLDAIARAQSAADDFGTVHLDKLLAEELLRYGASEGDRLSLSGPNIEFLPRAGQVMALAIHELAANAVEHSSIGIGIGRIEVDWSIIPSDSAPHLIFIWRERGAPSAVRADHRGFGTEVLTKMLRYEFNAETTLSVQPDAFSVQIRLPLLPHVGREA